MKRKEERKRGGGEREREVVIVCTTHIDYWLKFMNFVHGIFRKYQVHIIRWWVKSVQIFRNIRAPILIKTCMDKIMSTDRDKQTDG